MIWMSDEWKDYEVLDTSNGERLERWGKYTLVRPDPQMIWNTLTQIPDGRNMMRATFALLPAVVTGRTTIFLSAGRSAIRTT